MVSVGSELTRGREEVVVEDEVEEEVGGEPVEPVKEGGVRGGFRKTGAEEESGVEDGGDVLLLRGLDGGCFGGLLGLNCN